MIFSLSDFFGYSMAVTSACDYLNLSPGDFHNWEVRLDGVRFISGSLSYDVSLRQLEKPAKRVQGKPKKQKRPPAGKLPRVDIRALCLLCLVLR